MAEKEKIRKSSYRKALLYAKIRDLVLDMSAELQKLLDKEREAFGTIELSFNKSKVHVDKITLADKPLFDLRNEPTITQPSIEATSKEQKEE